MSGNIFLDTNAIINALNRGIFLPKRNYFISIITEMELLSFSRLTNEEELIIRELLSNFTIVNIENEIKEISIKIRKKYNLKLPDSIICASAISKESILISNDIELKKIEELKVIPLDDFLVSL